MNWFAVVLVNLLVAATARAESQANVALVEAAGDYPFGRLFTSPNERQVLNELRSRGLSLEDIPIVVPEFIDRREDEIALEPLKVRFSGYMIRADGVRTLWIDGKANFADGALPRDKISDALLIEQDRAAEVSAVTSRGERKRVIKPGQVWHVEEDWVAENYRPVPVTTPASAAETGVSEIPIE